ncbi:MAG TPA: sigma-70 family RNA polymerase sigma factor, partial [Kofleriaceae bacterium]|nr:sigma-70 family RNA polymerase sigma factor [Kofleriaceae bacterium]
MKAEQLLADAAWLRRLATSLAGNAADADDLVQESWIAAWRRRPDTDRSLRPWLAKVVRDVAGMTRRSERRRVAREQAALDPREVASPAAMLEQVRLHRLLADLVLALDEPFRSAIVARYVEGRSAADIARTEGIPDSTVRARLREGLSRLRAALDRETGERKAWAPAVLAFARGGLHVATPTKTIAAILAAVIALLLIGAVALVLVTRSHGEVGASEQGAAIKHRSGDSAIDDAIATIARGALPGWLAQPGVAGRRIAGHVIAQGQPVGAAVVRLTSDASAAGIAPVIERRTGTDGSFDFGVQPAMRFALGATSPGWLAAIAHVDVRDPTLRSEQLVLELEPCVASLYGRVVDAERAPIAHASLLREDVAGAESDDSGAYELCVRRNALVGDELHMIVRASGFAAIDIAVAVVGRIHHDVVLAREAGIAGRVITTAGAPVANAQVVAEPDEPDAAVPHPGIPRPARGAVATGEDGSFRISGLEPGPYHLAVRARAAVAAPVAVTTARNEIRDVTVTLIDAAVVHAHVQANGHPIGGVRVAIGSASAISQVDGD